MSAQNPPISSDFFLNVARGTIPGYSRVTALGKNSDIDSGTLPEDVWPVGGVYSFLAAASPLEVVSTSPFDTALGTGMKSVTISGLGAGYAIQPPDTVTLNGLTPVLLPKQWLRVNGAVIATGTINAGDVDIRVAGGGPVLARIPAGIGVTRQCVYTVPIGHTLSIFSLSLSCTLAGAGAVYGDFNTVFRNESGATRLPISLPATGETPFLQWGQIPIMVPEKTDFTIRVTDLSGLANNVIARAAFLGILSSNEAT